MFALRGGLAGVGIFPDFAPSAVARTNFSGSVAEWSIASVSKTEVAPGDRRFKSYPFRHFTETVRLVEDTDLKSATGKTVGGSNPSVSANLWQP